MVNIKSVLLGIAAALPIFRQQGSGHFIHYRIHGFSEDSTESGSLLGHESGCSCTLRWSSAGVGGTDTHQHHLPGFTDTAFSEHAKNPELKAQMQKAGEKFAMSPEAVANAVVYILQHQEKVNIGEVSLRSKAQP